MSWAPPAPPPLNLGDSYSLPLGQPLLHGLPDCDFYTHTSYESHCTARVRSDSPAQGSENTGYHSQWAAVREALALSPMRQLLSFLLLVDHLFG